MRLSSYHPIIALWLITKLILQPQISAADTALILSQGQENTIQFAAAAFPDLVKLAS